MLAKPFRIYIIATEESGDVLGADMLIELRRHYPQAQIAGIGGEAMRLAYQFVELSFDLFMICWIIPLNSFAVRGSDRVLL